MRQVAVPLTETESIALRSRDGISQGATPMTVKAFVCRLLIVLMAWTPYQIAQAGMIGTAQAISTASDAERGTVLNFVARSDVANQLQSFGINASNAKDRVAAMTDDEVRYLAGRIQTMPAGADAGDLLVIILIVAIIWWVWKR